YPLFPYTTLFRSVPVYHVFQTLGNGNARRRAVAHRMRRGGRFITGYRGGVVMERSDPWAGAVAAPLVGRLEKPRTAGLTMVIDKGLGLRETEDLLELAAGAIDYIKLAFGSSLLYPEPVLERKIALIRERGIH